MYTLKKVDYTSSGEKEEQFKSVIPTFLAPGTGFTEDNFSTGGERDGFRMIQVEWWGAVVHTDKALLTCLLLTSCCVAWFLAGHRLVLVCGLGVGDPWFKWSWQVCPPSHSVDLCFRMSRSQEAGICCSNLLFPPALDSGLPSHESPFPGKGHSSV